MGMDFNFGGVKASSGFDPLPEGTYNARIEEIEVRDTKEKEGIQQKTSDEQQAQYLNVTYKIQGGDYDGRFVWGINSIRFPNNPLDDTERERQTREIFLSWLNTVTGTDFADGEHELELNRLIGSPVRLVLTQREYNGNVTNNVKRVLSPEDDASNLEAVRRTL